MNHEFRSRRITLTISTLSLALNVLAIGFLQYLPNDPLSIVRYSTIYSCFAAGVSVCGIIGCIKSNQTLISILSNQLLLDAILLTIPRVVLLRLLIPFTTNICAAGSPFIANAGLTANSAPRHENSQIVADAHGITNTFADNLYISPRIWETWDQEGCCFAIKVVQVILGILCIVLPVTQWWCALKSRDYARMLAIRERRAGDKDERLRPEC